MRIAVTGRTGFLGCNVAKALLTVVMKLRFVRSACLPCCSRNRRKKSRRIHRTFFEMP